MRHSYDGRQRQQIDRHYKLDISYSEFKKLLYNVNLQIEQKGNREMNAVDFVVKLRAEHRVLENLHGYLFGAQETLIFDAKQKNGKKSDLDMEQEDKAPQNLVQVFEQ